MRRSLMFLSALLLFSSLAFARPSGDWGWGGDGNQGNDGGKHCKWNDDKCKKDHGRSVPELGVAPMLALSFATMAGGLALKRRRSA
jgi:hypothetical protein